MWYLLSAYWAVAYNEKTTHIRKVSTAQLQPRQKNNMESKLILKASYFKLSFSAKVTDQSPKQR